MSQAAQRHRSKVCAADVRVRIVEVRRVGHAKGIHFELKSEALADFEIPQQTHIEAEKSRAAQNIATRNTKRRRYADRLER